MEATFIKTNPELIAKFGHLLEGIEHPSKDPKLTQYEKNRMALMMENATKHFCLTESFRSLDHVKEAVNTTAAAVAFTTRALPMIRKVYPNMIARQLVSFQTMAQPTMKVFYYDIKRDDNTSLSEDIYNQRDYANSSEYASGNHPGDFNPAIKEINLSITDANVAATEKKLKAQWTLEAQQDIMAYHGLDVEQDMVGALASEVTRELDYTILYQLLNGATGGAATFDQTVPAGISYTDRKVWMEGIYEKMCDIDTQIFKKTYRKTTWAVTSPEIALFIEKMHGFVADTSVDQQVISTGGRYFTGTLNRRWKIFVDPFFPSNKLLMGRNDPNNWLDTCAVFCPYIPLYFSQTVQDPHSFKMVKSIMTRNAFSLTRGDLLGVLTVSGS